MIILGIILLLPLIGLFIYTFSLMSKEDLIIFGIIMGVVCSFAFGAGILLEALK